MLIKSSKNTAHTDRHRWTHLHNNYRMPLGLCPLRHNKIQRFPGPMIFSSEVLWHTLLSRLYMYYNWSCSGTHCVLQQLRCYTTCTCTCMHQNFTLSLCVTTQARMPVQCRMSATAVQYHCTCSILNVHVQCSQGMCGNSPYICGCGDEQTSHHDAIYATTLTTEPTNSLNSGWRLQRCLTVHQM